MGIVNDIGGAIGSVPGALMGGIGGGVAKYAPQNNYRAGDQEQFDLDKQKAAAFYGGLPDQLNAQANGTGPSAADAYMFKANQQATGSANALAQSARGGISPAMALRMGMNSAAGAEAQNAGTYSIMKNQEAQNAINQKANLSSFYDQLGQNGSLQSQGINAGISNNNTNAAANFGGQGMSTLGQMFASGAKASGGGSAYGGFIPGHAPMAGDTPENDVVNRPVSPGEAVLPRSISMAPDAPEKAKRYMEALQANPDDGFAALLHAHGILKKAKGRK